MNSSQVSSSQQTPPSQSAIPSPYPANSKAVYSIVERPGRQPYWLKIGIAFINRDGSFNIHLDAIPKDGKLQVRDHPPRDAARRDDEAPRLA